MSEGLGFGRRKLIQTIVLRNWEVKTPEEKKFNYNEVLFLIQEMLDEEGKHYLKPKTPLYGHRIFRDFVKHMLYRNIANYDSMVLLTSEKGCITGDALLEIPRDLKKYPCGVPLKELEGKGEIYIYCFNRETKCLELKKSDGVEFVKEDDVWEVELTNGMKIKATGDHPFLQMDGTYKQLKDLYWLSKKTKSGKYEYGRSMINGKLKYTDRLRLFCRPFLYDDNDNRLKIDYSDIKRKEGDTALKHTEIEHRFIMGQLGNDVKRKVVHHKNEKRYDNNLENLYLYDNQKQHYLKHGMNKYQFKENNKFCCNTGYSSKKKEKIFINTERYKEVCKEKRKQYCEKNSDKISEISKLREQNNINSNHIAKGGIIKSIKYIGKQKVYDVVNVRDNHNFIVNGFVVSNTGKSSAAIMLAREWCRLLGIKFNPARHIAYNNADVMNKIDMLNKFEPIVCVPGGSRIYIKHNNEIKSKKIKDLINMKDYEVLSYNEKDDKFEFQKPTTGAVYNKKDIVYEVELENGVKISATKEHKFLTKNRGYIKLKDLNEKDEIIVNSKKCIICKKEFFPHSHRIECCSKICSDLFLKRKRDYIPEHIKEIFRKYHKNKTKKNICYRLKHNLNTRIMRFVNIKTNKDEDRTTKIIGCNIEQLKKYLETQFKDEMNWNNYGAGKNKWSIDHKIQFSEIDINDKKQLEKNLHYYNIQPLWNNINSSKKLERICKICKNKFIGTHKSKYCSSHCRFINGKIRDEKERKINPQKFIEREKRYKENRKKKNDIFKN